MRGVGSLPWRLATSVGACLFWILLAQIAFTLTDTELSSVLRGEIGWGGVGIIAAWVVGIVLYALLARVAYRFEQSRSGVVERG